MIKRAQAGQIAGIAGSGKLPAADLAAAQFRDVIGNDGLVDLFEIRDVLLFKVCQKPRDIPAVRILRIFGTGAGYPLMDRTLAGAIWLARARA